MHIYFSFLLLTGFLKIVYKINVEKSIVFLHTCIEHSQKVKLEKQLYLK